MTDCIFCKIVKGEVQCEKVYEDEYVLAFLDISPVSTGHTLVVPKVHYEDLTRTPHEVACKCVDVIKKLAPAIISATGSEGFNIGLNNGKAAGQVVFHTHFHIIPRITNDELVRWSHHEYGAGEAGKVQKLIVHAIDSP
ncbi:MAG: HIT family protein [Candidatus Aenigmarchaeota archaeon]|nr:HIT family protein [Candidatus Aenigmarchaeota archaeon]